MHHIIKGLVFDSCWGLQHASGVLKWTLYNDQLNAQVFIVFMYLLLPYVFWAFI
jgi:hypothetical protein